MTLHTSLLSQPLCYYYFLQSDRIEDQFLGDLGQLVNLDLLSGPPPPKMGGGPSPANPFGTASSNPQQSLNPFEANKPPAPSLNQIAANKQPYGGPSEWTLYSYYRIGSYRIAGNFRGRKLSRIGRKGAFRGKNFRGMLKLVA